MFSFNVSNALSQISSLLQTCDMNIIASKCLSVARMSNKKDNLEIEELKNKQILEYLFLIKQNVGIEDIQLLHVNIVRAINLIKK